jgi:head-tail adaptor
MDIGALDRFVTIQRRVTTQDTTGQIVETWSTIAQVWANWQEKGMEEVVATIPGRRGQTAGVELARTKVVCTIRYRSSLHQGDRIVYGVPHDIVDMAEIGRRRFLRLTLERAR